MLSIDKFKAKNKGAIFVLTHAHTDHATLSATFPHNVHCSLQTKKLMDAIYPNVAFVPSLKKGWCRLKSIDVYVFESNHCIGGVGIFCQTLSLLHFGEGRPLPNTLQILAMTMKVFKAQSALTVYCDDFYREKIDFIAENRHTHPHAVWPSISQSQTALCTYLEDVIGKNPSVSILILISHFGNLQVLPRQFGYQYTHSNTESIGGTLCSNAFDLHQFQKGNIQVCRSWNHQLSEHLHVVHISMRWWLLQPETLDLLKPAVDSKTNYIRFFACSHASSVELSSSFNYLCAS
jgi:hypothetical protein